MTSYADRHESPYADSTEALRLLRRRLSDTVFTALRRDEQARRHRQPQPLAKAA